MILLLAAIVLFGGKTPPFGNDIIAKDTESKRHPAASETATPIPAEEPIATPDVAIPSESPTDTPVPTDAIVTESPLPADNTAPGELPYNAIGVRTDIPVLDIPVEPADLIDSIFAADNEPEQKYMSETQKAEFNETGLSPNKSIEPKNYKKEYTVAWLSQDNITTLVPELPAKVPLYAVSRAQDEQVFETAKQIAQDFNIGGTTMRTNANTYSTFNMQTGDLLMEYNLYKNIFEIPSVDISLAGGISGMPEELKSNSANALEWFLYSKGLLRFPYSAVFGTTDDGGKVVRFTPQLELPIIRLDYLPAQGDNIGLTGEDQLAIGLGDSIDARINHENKLTELYAFFPNLEKWGDKELPSKEAIAEMIKSGAFRYGDTELQYPGELTLEERQEYYNLLETPNITITDGELIAVDCGYFQEPEGNYQLFYQPTCIAYGQGYVGNYSALFGFVLSLAK